MATTGGEERADDLPRGALLMILSALVFAMMGVAVKLAARDLPNTMVVFFRSAVGLLALLPWVLALPPGGLRTTRPREHFVRGAAGLGAMYCFFYALAHMRLAEAVLLNYSLPLFMPFVEGRWTRVAIPRRVWAAVGIGFVGILLILKPGLGLFQPVALIGLLAALFAAVAQVGIRQLTHTEPVIRIVFYFGVASTVASALPLPWMWRTPRPGQWAVLLALGVLATLAQLLMTQAYGCAPAARVGPFLYTSVVFAGLLDWMLWGALPDSLALAGALLVAGSGIMALKTGTRPPAAPL